MLAELVALGSSLTVVQRLLKENRIVSRELKDSDRRTSSANRAQYPFAASDDGAHTVVESEVGIGKL